MKYSVLGQTDVKVSKICLGTMTWGEQNTQDEAFEQMNYALEHGVNFWDTAEMYPVPPTQPTYGQTETIIGNWLAQSQKRDQIVLASKVVGQNEFVKYIRDEKACLDRANIEQAIEGSLKRLQTDYLDLYQIHWPDRTTNFFGKLEYSYPTNETAIPIAETLNVMKDLVATGKVRMIGLSNETPWGVAQYLQLAETQNLPRVVSIQNPYNLLNRSFEIGLSEFSHRSQVGLLAYSPLAFGVLSGKYLGGAKPEGARLSLWKRFSRYTNGPAGRLTQTYVDLAKKYELDPAQMALAFVNTRPFVTSNIIGATTMDQLKSNIASINVELSEELLAEINKIHQSQPNPCP